jgi:hypothetical protein
MNFEEELQGKVESGANLNESDPDVRAFRGVFRALHQQKESALPPGFADGVVAKVIAKQHTRDARDHFWFGAGILFLIVCFVGTLLYTGAKIDLGFLKDWSGYAGPLVFGACFILLFQWLDRRIVQKKNTASQT